MRGALEQIKKLHLRLMAYHVFDIDPPCFLRSYICSEAAAEHLSTPSGNYKHT